MHFPDDGSYGTKFGKSVTDILSQSRMVLLILFAELHFDGWFVRWLLVFTFRESARSRLTLAQRRLMEVAGSRRGSGFGAGPEVAAGGTGLAGFRIAGDDFSPRSVPVTARAAGVIFPMLTFPSAEMASRSPDFTDAVKL